MPVAGYLKIKTKIDNKDIDKGVQELENKINKIETDNADLSKEQSSLQKEINDFEKMQQEADEYKNKIKELKAEKKLMMKENPSLAVQTDTPELTSIKTQIEEMRQKYAIATNEIDKQSPKIDNIYNKLNKVKAKQTENNTKIQQFKDKIESIKVNQLKGQIDDIGKSISGQIKKVGKMTLAIIGIRTAWMAVRRAVNLVAQYNPQVSADLEYMGYVLSSALAPAIQWLIQLAYELLSYINAIMSGWFGINLFSNASVKNFQKMRNSAGGTAKAVKEIQKSLEGFDEMNVLQDNSSASGGGGVSTPSLDLSQMQADVPKWLQWIIDNKDIVLSTLEGIGAAILGIKLGLGGIKSLGVGAIVGGLSYAIENFNKFMNSNSFNDFGSMIEGVGIALIGVATAIGCWPVAIAGALVLIGGMFLKHWDEIKDITQQGIDWLASKSDWIHEHLGNTIGNLYDRGVELLQDALGIIDRIVNNMKDSFRDGIQALKVGFAGDWDTAWRMMKEGYDKQWKEMKEIFLSVLRVMKESVKSVGIAAGELMVKAIKAVVNGVLWLVENVVNLVIRAINSTTGAMNNIPGVRIGAIRQISIPRLAKGGVISQPTTALIGEAGKEAVVPLENNMEWLDILADKLANKIGNNGGSYIVQLDGRTVQRGIAKRQQQIAFATNGR